MCPKYVLRARPGNHSFPTRRSSDLALLGRGLADRHLEGEVRGGGVDGPHPRHHLEPDGRPADEGQRREQVQVPVDRKSTRLNSSHLGISYAVFCLKKKIFGM